MLSLPTTVYQRVMDHALLRSSEPAVEEPGLTTSWRELEELVDAVSARFSDAGVGPGDIIATVLPAGRDLVAVALAAMSLGAGYAPVDPRVPDAAIHRTLDACLPKLTVSGHRVSWRAVAMEELTTAPGRTRALADVGRSGNVTADDVAYVVHTSGSTGVPKGVMVEHHSLLNLVDDIQRRVPVTAGHRGSWWTSPSFDVSMWECWSPLASGGSVAVAPLSARYDGPQFVRFLDEAAVASAYVPPAYLRDLRQMLAASPSALSALRRLLVGVEPIPLGLLQDIRALRPGLRILNGYGPAEATVCCALYEVPMIGGDREAPAPVGTPVHGMTFYLSNVGSGTHSHEGELIVQGPGVARGYRNVPSASGFMNDADFAPGQRVYRTGDRVRYDADGQLVFEGRVDGQLKVRGYRIEPGEVEAAVRQVSGSEHVVVATTGHGDDTALTAFLVAPSTWPLQPSELRRGMRKLVPTYAIPSHFVPVDRIPLTLHGKTDYAVLRDLVPNSIPSEDMSWNDDLAGAIKAIWQQELGDRFEEGEYTFVELGGTSLQATRVAQAISRRLQRHVGTLDVLDARSVSSLASLIEHRASIGAMPDENPRGARKSPLSPAQAGMWILDQEREEPGLYHEPACFEIQGPLDIDRLKSAVTASCAAHPAFTARILFEGREPEMELMDQRVDVERCQLPTEHDEEELNRLLLEVVREPFPNDVGPLIRCVLVETPSRTFLLFVWHHLVADGWSRNLFLNDLSQFYSDSHYLPSTSGYTICDLYLEARSRIANGQVLSRARRLAQDLASFDTVLPAVGDVSALASREGGVTAVEFDAKSVDRLYAYCQLNNITAAAVLCCAYQHAVAEMFGVQKFLMGCAVADRSAHRSQVVAGYLVNTLLIGCEPSKATSPEQRLQLAKHDIGHAVQNSDIPLPFVARELLDGKTLRGTVPQVYFSFDTLPELKLGSTVATFRPVDVPRARSDLALALMAGPSSLRGVLEYSHAALTEASASRLSSSLKANVLNLVGE